MERPVDNFWSLRLTKLKDALEKNNFEAYIADDAVQANQIVKESIVPQLPVKSVAFGGSMSMIATGLYKDLKASDQFDVIDTLDMKVSPQEMIERRRQALLVDLLLTGTNAITEGGQLVNLDMIGNRTGGIAFGPKNVIILVGRNKVVADLEEAFYRIKNYAAPANAMRLDKKTPCVKTSHCEECKSPDRICNTWSIMEKSFPKDRIKVVLINADLGL